MRWSDLPPEEIERRRLTSINGMKERDRREFERRYQEMCDRDYWTHGKCCSGCDHWNSSGGRTGECVAAGIVSGEQVMRSIGAMWSSYEPGPGFPLTRDDFYCGKFKDDFDWSTLDAEYLAKIGATRNGQLKAKPSHVRAT